MASGRDLLQFNDATSRMDIPAERWQTALEGAKEDPAVKIKIARVDGNSDWINHVASIGNKIGCHFHSEGDELYQVVLGAGTLYWGRVEEVDGEFIVHKEDPVHVETGDSFNIPEGYAHQLAKTGTEPLVITFGCPESHVSTDRTMLPDLV